MATSVQVRQVTGTDLDFIECVTQELLPKPPLMGFNEWQVWRKGNRPKRASDGLATTTQQEAELWRAVSAHYHGENWATLLAVQSAAPDDDEDEPQASGARSTDPPGTAGGATAALPTSGTAGIVEQGMSTPVRRPAEAPLAQPGSGDPAAPPASPGSQGRMSPASWHSASPGTPPTLTSRIQKPFDSTKETLEVFKARLVRQSVALASLGETLGEGVLEVLMAKADYDAILQRSQDRTDASDLRVLKTEFACEMADIDQSAEQASRLSALDGMLRERGIEVTDLKIRLAAGSGIVTPAHTGQPKRQPLNVSRPEAFRMHGQQGFITPRLPDGQVGSGADSAKFEAFEDRLKRLEVEGAAKALAQLVPDQPSDSGQGFAALAKVQERQTELMAKIIEKEAGPRHNASTIRVEPRVTWPKLGDDGPGGQEVNEFYDKLEEICGLANNGKGMMDKEMLLTLKNCLHGSRKKIYENCLKSHRASGLIESDDGPGIMYREIKTRLMRFVETATERQLRVRGEWNNLHKAQQTTGLQFEAEWERITAEMREVGLELSQLDLYLSYLMKVGASMGEIIRLDRRPRKTTTSDGEKVEHRLCESWEEAHEVMLEHEGVKTGSKAFKDARAAGLGPGKDSEWSKPKWDPQSGYQDGGGKGKNSKGKGKGKGDKGKGKGVCFEFRDSGKCTKENCKYSPCNEKGKGAGQQQTKK